MSSGQSDYGTSLLNIIEENNRDASEMNLLAARISVVMAFNPELTFFSPRNQWCLTIGNRDPYLHSDTQPWILHGDTVEEVALKAYEYIKTGVRK